MGYTIVYPSGDDYGLHLAKKVQNYYSKKAGVTLNIVDDSTTETEKEILIGDTNRYKTSLTEQEYAVTFKGTKLIFEAGHQATLEKAVTLFISQNYVPRAVNELSGVAKDFVSTLSIDNKTYSYVWGDEFDGNFLDLSKFTHDYHGLGAETHYTEGSYVSYKADQNTKYSKVANGTFTMRAEMDSDGNVKNSASICTTYSMWYKYGYAEMRAKIPLKHGAWPAWWATDHCETVYNHPFGFENKKYLTEIDMFEAFGSAKGEIKANIHKWYNNGYTQNVINAGLPNSFLTLTDSSGNAVKHTETMLSGIPNSAIISTKNEYHIFGFLWTPEKIQILLDGVPYATFDLTDEDLIDSYSDNSGYNDPMHLIFDNWLYLDGCFGADSSGNNHAKLSDFPMEYSIDYIRLYQTSGDELYNFGLNK